MCGLFGWFSSEQGFTSSEIVFKKLGYDSMKRGEDSTGIYYINGERETFKKYLSRFTSVYSELTQKEKMNISRSEVLIGHTRRKSCGGIAIRNAHPFSIGEWICAHNGHISNHESLTSENCFKYIPDGETDSEAVFCYLIENGITKDNLLKLNGSFNFSMYNKKTKKLHLISNNGSLYFIYYKNGLIYQSEYSVIDKIRKELGINDKVYKIENIACSWDKHMNYESFVFEPEKKKYETARYPYSGGGYTRYNPETGTFENSLDGKLFSDYDYRDCPSVSIGD